MTLTGGKRKVNKSLKDWVAFVKKVQKEEKLSYKDAIHRAKQRKDKGEKWMKGGDNTPLNEETTPDELPDMEFQNPEPEMPVEDGSVGGKRHRRRTMRMSRSRGRGRTMRMGRGRGKSRASRRH